MTAKPPKGVCRPHGGPWSCTGTSKKYPFQLDLEEPFGIPVSAVDTALGYQTEINSVNDGYGERIFALSYCAMCRSTIPFDEKTLELLRDAKTYQCQTIRCWYDSSDAREREDARAVYLLDPVSGKRSNV